MVRSAAHLWSVSLAQHILWHGWTSFEKSPSYTVQLCHTRLHPQSWNQPFWGLEGVEWQYQVVWHGEKCCTLMKCFIGSTYTMAWMDKLWKVTIIHSSALPHTIASSELKSAILGPGGGRMAIPSSVTWWEVLHTYEVFQTLNIYHAMDGQALKSHHHTQLSFATHDIILRVEISLFRGWRG